MATTLDTNEFPARLQRLDALLREAEAHSDPATRARFQEIVQSLLELHSAGLERLLDHVAEAGAAAQGIFDACARDDVVGGMLLLHGLHPLDVEERVHQALDSVRPSLHAHGGNIELIELRDGVARLRLLGSCHHCSSSSATMQGLVEEAIYGKAPEITSIEVEHSVEAAALDSGRVALPLV